MRRGVMRPGVAAVGAVLIACTSAPIGPAQAGPAVGQFELKTLESEPGEVEFQSQNAYAFGNPDRKIIQDPGGDIEADDNSLARQRNALELEFGITRYLKTRIGIEYEKERREDLTTPAEANSYEDLKLDEYAVEAIGIVIPRRGDGIGLGAVVEYEIAAEKGGGQSLNYGPIVEWANGPWLITIIPTLVQSFGGERNEAGQKDEKLDFAYANQIKYHYSSALDLAVEFYGTIDRICGRGGKSDEAALFGDFDQHRMGPVLYWNFTPSFAKAADKDDDQDDDEQMVSLGIGTLFGLNDNTPSTTLKLSMEVIF